jgi:serine/threonine protein kinase
VTTLVGRYQVLEAARPGWPQRARDLQTAQTVLLRDVALPRYGADQALARAQRAKGIFQPSLITLFDAVALPQERVLLAYEFVPAQTIAQVAAGSPFNLRRATEIVSEVADAIAELHAHDVAHGGVSQASVLITMKGKTKLDRVGDPSLHSHSEPSLDGDLIALTDLLTELVGRRRAGVAGAQAIETLISRARAGKFESAASFAAMLRRVAATVGR